MIELPPALEQAWNARGYYGSVSHNVKAIYQLYMGWFDGNPAHLWELPPEPSARKHVEYMGGAQAIIQRTRAGDEDPRWVAQVLNYVVFDDPGNHVARDLLAKTYERLGRGAENGTWRSPDVMMALTVDQLFDSIAILVDGPRAWEEDLTIDWNFTDLKMEVRLRLANGVLTHSRPGNGGAAASPAQLTLTLTKPQLLGMLATLSMDGIQAEGDQQALATLLGVLDTADPQFNIVIP